MEGWSHFSCGVSNVPLGASQEERIYFLKQKRLRKSLMGKFISDYFGKCFPRLIPKSRFCGLSGSLKISQMHRPRSGWMGIHVWSTLGGSVQADNK